jgi:hypothetical protein
MTDKDSFKNFSLARIVKSLRQIGYVVLAENAAMRLAAGKNLPRLRIIPLYLIPLKILGESVTDPFSLLQ